MELEKMRNLSRVELAEVERAAAEELFRLRFQKSLGNLDGVKKTRVLRLDIARAKTIAREQVIAERGTTLPPLRQVAPSKSTRTARKAKRK